MNILTLPGTDLPVSRLSFGTATLHHLLSTREIQRLLSVAADSGLTHFDTSPYYGFGLAESQLGLFMRRLNPTITVATKVGIYPPVLTTHSLTAWLAKSAGKLYRPFSRPKIDFSVARADASLNDSLKRLGREHVDILFLHEPRRELMNCDELLAWKDRILAQGKVRYLGLAGPAETFIDMTDLGPFSSVLQVKDSVENKEADVVLKKGRKLQLTYGYFSHGPGQRSRLPPENIISNALSRNPDGSVLISTRKSGHLRELVSIVAKVEAL